jgi:thiamine biosynthesis lipoprotein ApbE/Na+-translocating ferredoxin:NAD+ oxidoreductase RnfG subunit
MFATKKSSSFPFPLPLPLPLPLPAATLLAALCLAAPAFADDSVHEDVYLTRTEALREVFEDVGSVEEAKLTLRKEERDALEKRLGRRLVEPHFELYRGFGKGGELLGYAIITEEIGKFQPITFVVGSAPDAKVLDVAVMVYRESIGSEVKRRRFLSQFSGKSSREPLSVGRDIIKVSGATLSSHAISRGTKKVLAIVDEVLIGPRRRGDLVWLPVKLDEEKKVAAEGLLRRSRFLMGTVLEIACFGESEQASRAIAAAFGEVARLEGLLSHFRADSELSRVNREANTGPVLVSPETFVCIRAALDAARRTGGAFDPTLTADGYKRVDLDAAEQSVAFRRDVSRSAGLSLDLGGIGKGFALDRAAELLRRHGVRSAVLDFGGQILALDPPPGRGGWIVPVRDPGDPEGFLGYFEASGLSVATSALYERGSHIVDPRRGGPAAGVHSATVAAASATEADALSTALFVLGADAAAPLLSGVQRGSAVVVAARGGGTVVVGGDGGPVFHVLSPGGTQGGGS